MFFSARPAGAVHAPSDRYTFGILLDQLSPPGLRHGANAPGRRTQDASPDRGARKRQRIERHDVLSLGLTTVILTAVDGSGREQLVLDSTLVPFWLATMDADDQEPFQIFEKVSPATPIHWYIWCSAPAPLVEQLQLGPLGGLDLVRGGGVKTQVVKLCYLFSRASALCAGFCRKCHTDIPPHPAERARRPACAAPGATEKPPIGGCGQHLGLGEMSGFVRF